MKNMLLLFKRDFLVVSPQHLHLYISLRPLAKWPHIAAREISIQYVYFSLILSDLIFITKKNERMVIGRQLEVSESEYHFYGFNNHLHIIFPV